MKKAILVLEDLGQNARSKKVQKCGVTLAKSLKAPLTLFNVQDVAPELYLSYGHEIIESVFSQGKKDLAKIKKEIGHPAKILQARGNPASEILSLAKKNKYECIVQGTSSLTGLGPLILGSVAESVIRGSDIPVITVGPAVKEVPKQFLKILVPTTLTRNTKHAEKVALSLAKDFKAQIILMHNVFDSLHPVLQSAASTSSGMAGLNPILENLKKQARKKLLEKGKIFEKAEIKVETILNEGIDGSTAAILHEIPKVNLVVMGTHGRTIPGGFFFGRCAREVITKSSVPVITVKSKAE